MELVSEWLTDKHCQWSDSGPIKINYSCWLCNGCTITSQTLEATLTEWPFRWITLDIVVLWLHLFYFHQLLDEMVTWYILIYEKRQKIFYLIVRGNQLEVLQSPTISSLHCLNVMCLSRIDVTRLFILLCWRILFAAYFHQAIAESGSALSGWAFDSKPEQHGKVVYCWSLFLFYFLISYFT